jgi:hemolysin activation/secretion protein
MSVNKLISTQKIVLATALFFVFFLLFVFSAVAAPPSVPTDSGRELQDIKARPQPAISNPEPAPLQAPSTATDKNSSSNQDIRIKVGKFAFTGNSVITDAQLQAAVAEFTGRELTFGELQQVTERVEALYHKAGYFLTQAVLPPQQIQSGTVNINIIEGNLGKVRLEGESRISPDVMYRYLDKLPKGNAVTEAKLDRQALLINDLAGGTASMDLQAGDEPGTTDVVLLQKPERLFTGRVGLDNHGLPATGEYRLGINAALNSPLHLGDRLTGNVVTSNTGKLQTYGLRYDLPIGGDGWRAHLAKTRAVYTLGGAFSNLNANGTADSWQAGVSYPWLRSRDANIFTELQVDSNRLTDNLGALGLNLKKRSYALSFTPYADWRDKWLGGGANQTSLELRTGKLNLGNDAKLLDLPPAGANTDGNFTKVIFNIERQQYLAKNISLTGRWKQQFASTNLDSSEKVTIGGAQIMLAYPVGQASADEAGVGKLALNWQADKNLYFSLFAEYAHLDLLHDPIAGSTGNQVNLRDAGLAMSWRVLNGIDFSSSIAWAGRDKPNPDDNDRPRIWANLGYNW